MNKKRKRLLFAVITGLIGITAFIPVYYFVLDDFFSKEPNIIMNFTSSNQQYHWENVSISWEVENIQFPFNYSLAIDDNMVYEGINFQKPHLSFNFTTFDIGEYLISLSVTDNSSRSASNSTTLSILRDSDTDQDGLFDHEELWIYFSNPSLNDTDQDLLSDGDEILIYNTNATDQDTDHDNLTDYNELKVYFTDPNLQDSDLDGWSDWYELNILHTNASNNDTDYDTIDDFSEIQFYSSDPLFPNPPQQEWEGGTVILEISVKANQPNFLPHSKFIVPNQWQVPRTLYLYLIKRIRENSFFYVKTIKRVSPIKIMVIDNFNSEDIDERVHGTTCVSICDETIENNLFGNINRDQFQILTYSVSESNQTWGTAIEYGIREGIDVISLSQVSSWGFHPYFTLIESAVNDFGIVFCAGTGNDNNGDNETVSNVHIRYPASHPNTLAIGGVVQESNDWVRWDVDNDEGSNYGRGTIEYKDITYNTSVQLVENAYRRIYFTDYFGVSWAIPRVAGMAAIMLLINPLLVPANITQIMLENTYKISPIKYQYNQSPFPSWPNGWNAEVGYGKPNFELIASATMADYLQF